MSYCFAEKFLLAIDLIVLALLCYQLFIVYRHNYKLNFRDKRIQILGLCVAASFYTVVHYGVMPRSWRASNFVNIEFFRLCILYYICLFFCEKASGLLKNRKIITIFLQVFFGLSSLLMLTFGIWVAVLIWTKRVTSGDLCTTVQY